MLEHTTQDSLPRRLGVYEVVTPIAKRAASTVVIAHRPITPSAAKKDIDEQRTYEHPVAIKRIAPALVQMNDSAPFLVAMNRVAKLQHENAVRILEAAHDQGELFVVMEYLEGESVASLLRRAQGRGETLDFALSAYLIAEASAALHAAHEMNILHTHITPRDLFVCYDGTVKVLDLGVASALDRMAEAEMRGRELQYASPERCRREKLDRQTDVFSLGAILWELAAGTSPFDRVDEADTIRAICEESIVPPATVVRGLPTQFSDITMNALMRSRPKRYQTTRVLREALLDLIKRLGMQTSLKADLSHVMHKLFDDRIQAKKEMIERTAKGATVMGLDLGELFVEEAPAPSSSMPAPPVKPPKPPVPKKSSSPPPSEKLAAPLHAPPKATDVLPAEEETDSVVLDPSISVTPMPTPVSLPIGSHRPRMLTPTEMSTSRAALAARESARASAAKSRVPLFVALFGVLLAIGTIGAAFGLRAISGDKEKVSLATSAKPAMSTATTTATSPATAVVSAAAPPSEEPASSAPTAAATPSQAAPVIADESLIHVETVPSKATIFVGGAKKGTTPLDLKVPKTKDPVTLEIRHPGYQTHREKVVPDVDQKLRLTLLPAKAAGSADLNYRRFD